VTKGLAWWYFIGAVFVASSLVTVRTPGRRRTVLLASGVFLIVRD
jgi:hypothetical protein